MKLTLDSIKTKNEVLKAAKNRGADNCETSFKEATKRIKPPPQQNRLSNDIPTVATQSQTVVEQSDIMEETDEGPSEDEDILRGDYDRFSDKNWRAFC